MAKLTVLLIIHNNVVICYLSSVFFVGAFMLSGALNFLCFLVFMLSLSSNVTWNAVAVEVFLSSAAVMGLWGDDIGGNISLFNVPVLSFAISTDFFSIGLGLSNCSFPEIGKVSKHTCKLN